MTVHRTIIVLLAALLIWFGVVIVRLENYHYANQVGMCQEPQYIGLSNLAERDDCLARKQTRTSWAWHLWYALAD